MKFQGNGVEIRRIPGRQIARAIACKLMKDDKKQLNRNDKSYRGLLLVFITCIQSIIS